MKKLLLLCAIFCVFGTGAFAQIEQDTVSGDPSASLPLKGGTLEGDLIFAPDGLYDIGSLGANRPDDIFTDGDIHITGEYYGEDDDTYIDMGTNRVSLFANGIKIVDAHRELGFEVQGSNNLIWQTDGGGDIGASGANRPANIYSSGDISAGDELLLPNNEYIRASSDPNTGMKFNGLDQISFDIGGFTKLGMEGSGIKIHGSNTPLEWITDGGGNIGKSDGGRPWDIYAADDISAVDDIEAREYIYNAVQDIDIADSGDANPATA